MTNIGFTGRAVALGLLAAAAVARADGREYVWPEGKMPDFQPKQIAAMTDEAGWYPRERKPGFDPAKHRTAYLEWQKPPAADAKNGICMILISGGGYDSCCDVGLVKMWNREFTAFGCQCVNFVYRTPRPEGIPFYKSAWEDAQRAVRLVRSQAAKYGFDPERIGAVGMSAGAHLTTLLATSSQTPAYAPVDGLDGTPCHLNFAITAAIPYGYAGTRTPTGLSDEFKFDAKTAPMCMLHGGADGYVPEHSTHVYRELRKRKIPAELHVFSDRSHGFWGFGSDPEKMTSYDRWFAHMRSFIRQMNFDRKLGPEVASKDHFTADVPVTRTKQDVWPEGKTPDFQADQCVPYLEWFVPQKIRTRAIQIIYSGGAYGGNNPDEWDGVPAARRFLNAKGMTVVVLKYRTPRPKGRAKHVSAWQDLQRTIRLVRSQANARGLDPNRIGIWGSSAGGHLTLLGATSSTVPAYAPVDAVDALPCNVQWAVPVYPAYVLTDGADRTNTEGGNSRDWNFVPELAFDALTCPMVLLHGDADGWAAMNSVKTWERLHKMNVQSDLHTFAKRGHCFMMSAAPGTASYEWLDRVWEFLNHKGFNR